LADHETAMSESQRINSMVTVIALALTEVLEAVRARMMVLEGEGCGRGVGGGGAACTR